MSPNQTWPISTDEVRLGRKRDENDIPLKGLSASRHHAVIRCIQGEYVIFTLNPKNPVIVNDQPVIDQQILHNGDLIRAGETVLRFELPGQGG